MAMGGTQTYRWILGLLLATSTPWFSPAAEPAAPPAATRPGEGGDIRVFHVLGTPDAGHLRDLITKLYRLDMPQRDPQMDESLGRLYSIAADDQTGQLVAAGDHRAMECVGQLVNKLSSVTEPTTEYKLFTLKHGRAASAAKVLNELLKVNSAAPASKRAAFMAIADDQSNTLVIAADSALMNFVESLLRSIDAAPEPTTQPAPATQPAGPMRMKMFPLIHRTAPQLAKVIKDAVAPNGSAARDLGSFHSITFEPDTNTLIIVGDGAAIETATRLVEHFDSNPVPAYEVKIFFVRSADATKVAKLLNDIFNPPAPHAPLPNGGWFRAVGNADSNTVVIIGDLESVKIAEEVVAKADSLPDTRIADVHVYRLKHSNAQKDATLLKELFNRKGYRAGGTPGAPEIDSAHDWLWNIVADEQSNSLIVASCAEATTQIRMLIEELDKAPATTQPGS
jgi:type II secretory pathway component GspD/PulD (secretin)